MNAVANIANAGDNAVATSAVDITNARNFHTYVRRATDEELAQTERVLAAKLSKSDESGIRTQMVDIIKERLQVVRQALALPN